MQGRTTHSITKKRQYSVESMRKAIAYVKNKKGSVREAARRFGVPRSSVQFKLTHPNTKSTSGPSAILNKTEEMVLADLIISLDKRGFPRKRLDIQMSAQKILEKNPRKNPFRNNRPNAGWFTAFLRRHPHISLPHNSSAYVTVDDTKTWYHCIRQLISQENLFSLITDPKRLFKVDKTIFNVCNNTGKVFTDFVSQNTTKLATVLFSFSAVGLATKPILIYPCEEIPEKITESIPEGWGISYNDQGKVTVEAFYHYIKNVFYPNLVQEKIKFPIILFVDRRTPVTLDIWELCKDLGIHLIAIYPHGTSIQAVVCQPLKSSWKKGLQTSYQTPLTKLTFAPLFKIIFYDLTNKDILIQSFHKLGLFPFDEENIDCSKENVVLKETVEVIEQSDTDDQNHDNEESFNEAISDTNVYDKAKFEEQNQMEINSKQNMKLVNTMIEVELLDDDAPVEAPTEYLDSDSNTDLEVTDLLICDICLDNIIDFAIECCKCLNRYHLNCITSFYKDLIPSNEDEFVCHNCL